MVVALLGAAVVAFFLRADDASRGDAAGEGKGGEAKQVPAISDSEELERSSVRRSERKEVPASPPGKPPMESIEQAAVLPSPEVVRVANRIEKMMLDDEAARATLVKETKDARTVVYRFEISRREDYNKVLDELLRQEAKSAGLDVGTLGGAVRQKIKHLDIPEGHRQLVQIRVPLESDERVHFTSFAVRQGVELKGTIQAQNVFSGSSMGSEDWRYSRLLDLGNP